MSWDCTFNMAKEQLPFYYWQFSPHQKIDIATYPLLRWAWGRPRRRQRWPAWRRAWQCRLPPPPDPPWTLQKVRQWTPNTVRNPELKSGTLHTAATDPAHIQTMNSTGSRTMDPAHSQTMIPSHSQATDHAQSHSQTMGPAYSQTIKTINPGNNGHGPRTQSGHESLHGQTMKPEQCQTMNPENNQTMDPVHSQKMKPAHSQPLEKCRIC